MQAPLDRETLVSAIIPTFGRPALVRKAVLSLMEQDLEKHRYEIIVVDTSLTDENTRVLAELAAVAPCSLRWFSKSPEGPGPSRNLGASEARGKYLAFMDSDCQASPGWLRQGVAGFVNGVGIVQGRTLPNPSQPLGVFKLYISVEQESYLYETANILYDRECFERAGGFTKDMTPGSDKPMGGEDVDLAWRVKRQGWKTKFAFDALVYHEVVPISPWGWLFNKRLYIFPSLARRYPELRQFFFARYFLDRTQAAFVLGLTGLALSAVSSLFLLLWVPYVILRGSESTETLRGGLRVVRVFAYAAKDTLAFLLLLAGSLRYRSILL